MKSKGTVDRIHAPSFEDFEREFRRPGKPCVITGATDDWAATSRWSIDYFTESVGDSEIIVDRLPEGRRAGLFDRRLTVPQRITLRDYLATIRDPDTPKLYLVALSIPAALPTLLPDLGPLPWVQSEGRMDPLLFFAAAGSKTSLHSDFPDNLHFLASGHKRVTLVDWRQSSRVYQDSIFSKRPNYSNVDVDAPDYERHPRFKGVDVLEAEIFSGDILYIPSFWWHRVHTVSTSIAVTNFWGGRKTCLPYFRIVVTQRMRLLASRTARRVKARLRRS